MDFTAWSNLTAGKGLLINFHECPDLSLFYYVTGVGFYYRTVLIFANYLVTEGGPVNNEKSKCSL